MTVAAPPSTCRVDSSPAPLPGCRSIEGAAQASQRERAEHETQVAERDVVVAPEEQEVEDDPQQPCRHDVAEEPGLEGDSQARHDLNDAHDEHGWVGAE